MNSACGVDGCRSGWVAVIYRGASITVELVDDAGLTRLVDLTERTFIDIPIGLPDSDERHDPAMRACDAAARALLGTRRSTIFPVPVRAAVYAHDYQSACRLNERETGRKFSIQAWHILPKIRSVDAIVRADRSRLERMYESHPELCFLGWTGNLTVDPLASDGVLEPKRTPAGERRRMEVLRTADPKLADSIIHATRRHGPIVAGTDDLIDAAILALSALHSVRSGYRLLTLPIEPEMAEFDRFAIPARISMTLPGAA